MKALLKKIAKKISTQVVFVSSAIVAGTGLYMYFVAKSKPLNELHSYVGILFIIASLLHILKNWAPTKNIFKNKILYISTTVVLILSAVVYVTNIEEGVSPKIIIQNILDSSITSVSAIFKVDSSIVIARMQANGIIADNNDTLNSIAQKNNAPANKLLIYFIEKSH